MSTSGNNLTPEDADQNNGGAQGPLEVSELRYRRLFEAASGLLGKDDFSQLDPADAKASRLVAPPALAGVPKSLRETVAASRGASSREHSIEYTWTGRKVVKDHVHISLLTVHADARGIVLRSRLLQSS